MFGNSVFRAYHDFPRHGSYACPRKFNQSPFGIQNPKLVFTLRQFQEGRRVTGPFYWTYTQGQYGPGPKAYMGLGSRPVWALGSRCRTPTMFLSKDLSLTFYYFFRMRVLFLWVLLASCCLHGWLPLPFILVLEHYYW